MNPPRPIPRRRVAGPLACTILLLTSQPAASDAFTTTAGSGGRMMQSSTQLRDQALELAYNLDHDEAIALLRRAVQLAPGDPAPHRSLAATVWLQMLFRRGAVTVDHYLGSFSKASVDLKKPPPDLDAEFRRHVASALDLARRRVAARPRDPQAHYDLGAALGLEASYVATVEGRLWAGFQAAKGSYDAHEKVLSLDPSRKDAGLIVGTYRYVVSTLSLPARWMAYVVGFGGDKQRGIRMLEETAASPTEVRTDAMFALVLIYNRERRYDDAMRVLQGLRRLYPRNRLIVLEAGATALRAGRYPQADELLTEGLAMLAKEKRPRIPGEDALWRYKRGSARAGAGRTEGALADLRAATAPDAQHWVSGRARVELGRLALKQGNRAAAAAEARQAEPLCKQGNDSACVADARRLLRSADGR
jgi:tetratricopeptide (TPR) repeat protein